MNLLNLELSKQLPPEEVIFQMALTAGIMQSLVITAKLGIADLLKDGPKHCDELAQATDTHSHSLYRFLRALASVGVFAETEPKCFELTPLAACLQDKESHSIRHFLLFLERTYSCWGDAMETLRTGKDAHERIYGMSMFQYLDQNQDSDFSKIYDRGMAEVSLIQDSAIISAYDFSTLEKLVDVGGGTGNLLAAILQKYPSLKGTLFDRPRAAEKAKILFEEKGLTNRCEAVGGDFFKSQIPSRGDAYLFKYVLHTWDDQNVVKVLKSCHQAMAGKGRLLVIERVITEDTFWMPKFADLNLLMLLSAAVRTEEEFRSLFEAAGFELTRVIPAGSIASLLEGKII
ncbi:MAG: methyltransferase [Gammaproteobacteria bacterium]|nr:MAG: methyltransferase [Gammaproteobacteria bacterium]RKZ43281.1 MAG: methyltransferase [Gammaproteobacteria bacterium]RKZ76208.1 MAG: methyltransferase [Gammaproteobacteria bacterium]